PRSEMVRAGLISVRASKRVAAHFPRQPGGLTVSSLPKGALLPSRRYVEWRILPIGSGKSARGAIGRAAIALAVDPATDGRCSPLPLRPPPRGRRDPRLHRDLPIAPR